MSENPDLEPGSAKKKDPIVSAVRYSELGFIIPAAVLLGFFLGKVADHWLHTKWIYLAGLLFGAAGCTCSIFAFGRAAASSHSRRLAARWRAR